MILVKSATLLEHWFDDLPDKYIIWHTESGYSNDEVALHWIKHFHNRTKDYTKGIWRVLFCDGHGSHDTKEFIDYAAQNRIQLIALPEHLTHEMQPLDVGCFQPLK